MPVLQTWSPLNPTQIMWFQLAQLLKQIQLTESSTKPEGSSFWQVAQHSDSVVPVCFACCFSPCAFDFFDLNCVVLSFLEACKPGVEMKVGGQGKGRADRERKGTPAIRTTSCSFLQSKNSDLLRPIINIFTPSHGYYEVRFPTPPPSPVYKTLYRPIGLVIGILRYSSIFGQHKFLGYITKRCAKPCSYW